MYLVRLNFKSSDINYADNVMAFSKLALSGITDPSVYKADPVCGAYCTTHLDSITYSGTPIGSIQDASDHFIFSTTKYKLRLFKTPGLSSGEGDRIGIAVAPLAGIFSYYANLESPTAYDFINKKVEVGSASAKLGHCSNRFGSRFCLTHSYLIAEDFCILSGLDSPENTEMAMRSFFSHTKNGISYQISRSTRLTSILFESFSIGNSVFPDTESEILTFSTNYGPMVSMQQEQVSLVDIAGYHFIPPMIKGSSGSAKVKPVFQFSTYRYKANQLIDHSADCNVLTVAYGSLQEITDQVVNAGTTYNVIGHYLVPA